MNFDHLKVIWEKEILAMNNNQDFSAAIETLETETTLLDKKIKRRDYFEISGSVVLIPILVMFISYSDDLTETLGYIIIMLTCIFAPFRYLQAKNIKASKIASIKSFLDSEKQKIEKQIRLSESVMWWGLGPMFVGVVFIVVGGSADISNMFGLSNVLLLGSYAVLLAGIYWLNKRAVKKDYRPLLEKIDKQIMELKELQITQY